MTDPDYFRELIRLARAGDETACTRLACEFEPFMRRVVRFRMRCRTDRPQLRHEVDSLDICQSVFKSLFLGLCAGRFDLGRPEHLEKLLAAMVRFKVSTRARRLSVVLRELIDPAALSSAPTAARAPRKRSITAICSSRSSSDSRPMSSICWPADWTINRGLRSPSHWAELPRPCARSWRGRCAGPGRCQAQRAARGMTAVAAVRENPRGNAPGRIIEV